MTDPLARDYQNSAAVLVGTWTYTAFPSVPAAQNSLNRMKTLLTSDLCRWPEDRVYVYGDAPHLQDLNTEIAQKFESIRDVALFYYVGHGMPDEEDQLCLTLPGTRQEPNLRQVTSLGFKEIRRALRYSNAKTKIVILDCCFSGLAIQRNGVLSSADVLAMTSGTGAIVITASGAYNTAWFEQSDDQAVPHTYFTRYLAETVENGIAGMPPYLTLKDIYEDLSERLRRDSLPSPMSNVRDHAGNFPFARNNAPHRPAAPIRDAMAITRILADVEERTQRLLEERVEAAIRDLEVFKAERAQRSADERLLRQLDDSNAALPFECRLLDLLGLPPEPTADAIVARWTRQAAEGVARAVIGMGHDGPFSIDLPADGPNALIGGTTGSGKTELLRTMLASLAVANKPTAMTFLLIDYKAGAAFGDCINLPHTVGLITDLDGHLAERGLKSLLAEIKRREHLLAEAKAKNIDDYAGLVQGNPQRPPIPHLLIVIDEFASMVRELPDFLDGLVQVAQRGRTTGVHLILATQRPSGVISPEIRANTNLRIALRVTDDSESIDVIDARNAGFISRNTPGRAFARAGTNALVAFQTGRTSHTAPEPQTRQPGPAFGENTDKGDLEALVQAVRDANTQMQIPRQHSPWLPPLPDVVLLSEAPPVVRRSSMHDLAPVPWGIDDLPAEQRRRAATLDFATLGHMLICGAPRTGRSQVLRTMAGAIALTQSTADVHIYGIDCGSGALLPLTALPHCGTVVQRHPAERATRLINRLVQENTDRQEKLAAQGFASIVEQRLSVPADQRMPHIVVFLDRWDGFLASLGDIDGGVLVDQIMTIMREGREAGMHVVIAGDRQVLSGRVASLTEDKMSFRLADKFDFGLIGLRSREIPNQLPPGRAFRAESGIETHVALLTADPSGPAQAAALQVIGDEAKARDAAIPRSRRPFRVDALPTRVTFTDAWELREAETLGDNPLWALVGVGGDELAAVGADMTQGIPSFIVAGPPKSGRSTVLATMARSMGLQGASLIIVAPRPSPLRTLTDVPGLVAMFQDPQLYAEELSDALNRVAGRPVAVLIDDAEMLRTADAGPILTEIITSGTDRRQALIVAGDAEELNTGFSGWHVDARRGRRGALLSPQSPMDSDLIGARITRSATGGQIQPGRALVHLRDGVVREVRVPLLEP